MRRPAVVLLLLLSFSAFGQVGSHRGLLENAVDSVYRQFIYKNNERRIRTPLEEEALKDCRVPVFEGNCTDFTRATHLYLTHCTELTSSDVTYKLMTTRAGVEHVIPCVYERDGTLFCGDYRYRVQPWSELEHLSVY